MTLVFPPIFCCHPCFVLFVLANYNNLGYSKFESWGAFFSPQHFIYFPSSQGITITGNNKIKITNIHKIKHLKSPDLNTAVENLTNLKIVVGSKKNNKMLKIMVMVLAMICIHLYLASKRTKVFNAL